MTMASRYPEKTTPRIVRSSARERSGGSKIKRVGVGLPDKTPEKKSVRTPRFEGKNRDVRQNSGKTRGNRRGKQSVTRRRSRTVDHRAIRILLVIVVLLRRKLASLVPKNKKYQGKEVHSFCSYISYSMQLAIPITFLR
jgi:hypothetical protein